jgi:YaiO family outer membrane protein
LAALLVALSATCAWGMSVPEFPYEIEAGTSHSDYSHGAPDGSTRYLETFLHVSPMWRPYGRLTDADTFGKPDQQAIVGAYVELDEGLILQTDIQGATPGNVLPEWGAHVAIEWVVGSGWTTHGGLEALQYAGGGVTRANAGADYHFLDLRTGYSLFYVVLDSGESSTAHAVSGSWYYLNQDSATIVLSKGESVEHVPGTEPTTHSIQSVTLWGRHWFLPRWALSYELRYEEYLDRYDVRTIRAGVRHAF